MKLWRHFKKFKSKESLTCIRNHHRCQFQLDRQFAPRNPSPPCGTDTHCSTSFWSVKEEKQRISNLNDNLKFMRWYFPLLSDNKRAARHNLRFFKHFTNGENSRFCGRNWVQQSSSHNAIKIDNKKPKKQNTILWWRLRSLLWLYHLYKGPVLSLQRNNFEISGSIPMSLEISKPLNTFGIRNPMKLDVNYE